MEAAGAASLAAVLEGKVSEIVIARYTYDFCIISFSLQLAQRESLKGKKVVCVLTGGNVSPEEIVDIFQKC